jgi:hypothetical protein
VVLPSAIRADLQRSSRQLVEYLKEATQTEDSKTRSAQFFLALSELRASKRMLDEWKIELGENRGPYEVLNARLEKLCEELSSVEGGQLRMFG